jgi:hypothetical protein
MGTRHLLTPALDPPGADHRDNRLVSEIHVGWEVGRAREYSFTFVR